MTKSYQKSTLESCKQEVLDFISENGMVPEDETIYFDDEDIRELLKRAVNVWLKSENRDVKCLKFAKSDCTFENIKDLFGKVISIAEASQSKIMTKAKA